MNNTLYSFAQSLSTETGIDLDSATKVIGWLVSEGVLDIPVVNETYVESETKVFTPTIVTNDNDGVRD